MIPTGSSLTESATSHSKMEERRDRTAQGLPSHSTDTHTGMNINMNVNVNDEMHEILPDDMDFLSFFNPTFNDFNDNDDSADNDSNSNSNINHNNSTATTTTASNSIQDRFPLSFLPDDESASTLKKNDASTLSMTTEDPVFQGIDPRVSSTVTTPMQSIPIFDDPLYNNNFTDIPQASISSSMHDQILDFNDYQTGDLTGIWDFNVDQFQMTPSSSSDITTISAPNSFIQENHHIYSFLSNNNSNNNNNNNNFLNSFGNGNSNNGNYFGTSLTMDHSLYPHAGFSTAGNFQTSVYQPHSPVSTSVKPISTSKQRSKISKSSQLQAISIPLSSPSTAYSIRKTSLQRQPPTPLGSLNKRSSGSFTSTGLSTSASLSNSNLAGFGGKPQVQCFNCKTFKTPLWRRDPAGNTLCNACGLFQKLHGTMRPLSMKSDVIKKRASRKKKNKNNNKTSTSTSTFTSANAPTTAKKAFPVKIAHRDFIPTPLSNSVPTTGMSTATTTATAATAAVAATSYIDSVNTANLRGSLASDLTTNGYISSPRDMGSARGSAAASALLRTTVSPSLPNDFRSETVSKSGTGSSPKAVATGMSRSAMLQHAYREATAHLPSFPSDSNIAAAAAATTTATATTDPFDNSALEAPFRTGAASIPTSNPTVTHQSLLSRQLQNSGSYNQHYQNQQQSTHTQDHGRINYLNSTTAAGYHSPMMVKKNNKKSEQQPGGVSTQEQLLYIPTDSVNAGSHIASNTLGAGVAGSNNMPHEYDWSSFL